MSSTSAQRTLYPEIAPRKVLAVDVGDAHRLYVEDCGNERGLPVVFLHGGPGSSCKPYHRQFFDAQRYRIILFDQRGCGRSQPSGSLRNNSTDRLVSDMEAIRSALDIERWMIFGGSWGSTLGLLYAQAHPDRVSAMVLRGSFLARQQDLDWFLGERGARRFYPEHWQAFLEQVPEAGDGEVLQACHTLITAGDSGARERVARAWSQWATRIVSFSLDAEPGEDAASVGDLIDKAALEIHYAAHRYFIADNQILDNIGRLPNVPVLLVHGRRDLTCLPEASWLLYRAIPGARLEIIPRAGHLASEPPTIDALVRATDEMPRLVR